MADTTNFGWTKPTVGSDTGAWGGILNTLFDDADTDLNTVKTTADAAMPKAGGVFSGVVENINDRYVMVDHGSSGGTRDLDVATANFFVVTKSGALTFTFSNPAASGKVSFFMLELTNGSGAVWPASVDWPGGSAPTLQASGVDVLTFFTRDGGTTWHGALGIGDTK